MNAWWYLGAMETYLDDLIAREGEEGNIGGIAGHQVAVEDA